MLNKQLFANKYNRHIYKQRSTKHYIEN